MPQRIAMEGHRGQLFLGCGPCGGRNLSPDVSGPSVAPPTRIDGVTVSEERTLAAPPDHKGVLMGLGDKMEEMADKVKSKISGDDATDNPDLETEERAQEA